MTRQETVIKITKITRIIGEMKSQLDLDDEIEFEALDSSWANIGKWTKEIYQYMEQAPSPLLADLITNNEFTTPVVNYVQSHKQNIDSTYVKVIDSYAKNMQALLSLCEEQREKLKGEYKDLTGPLANEQVATLLQRAIRAGLLDEHYQPMPQTKPLQLKVIAYAISAICKLSSPYVHFEKQWKRENGKRFSTSRVPRYNTALYDTTKALYPEVDFTEFEPIHEAKTFYTPQSEQDIRMLYHELVKYCYIAPSTTFETFAGIFDKTKFSKPIEWIKAQRQLSYFVYLAFYKFNKKDLWIKGECCFSIDGHSPHKACFVSGYSWIKRAGWLDRYDVKLKAICDEFNHIENTPERETSDERLIHTSKVVFHSTSSEEDIHSMFSALVEGGYIDSSTEFTTFRGIFDETMFEHPIVWMKTQALLMYFVHLAFKPHNPYDVWVKCANCFRLRGGKTPNRQSMDSNFRFIVKKGLLATYDIRLKTIADNYHSNKNKNADITSSMKESIST